MIISNVDDALFDRTRPQLGVDLDWVVTAERARSYKPSLRNFEIARAVCGASTAHWLHVAQSLHHDVAPAREIGLATVWVNRRRGRAGSGATPGAPGVAPDLEVGSLEELVSRLGPSRG